MNIDLDPAHLRALREAWQKDSPVDLTRAVRDLFDGQDGELRVVNEALAQARPSQLDPGDEILQSFGTWAIVRTAGGALYVSHVGHPVGWSAICYDIEFPRLGEDWERQLGEKSWMSPESKAELAEALQVARALKAAG